MCSGCSTSPGSLAQCCLLHACMPPATDTQICSTPASIVHIMFPRHPPSYGHVKVSW
jgi:hypothetical protein